MPDVFKLDGFWKADLYGPDDTLKQSVRGHNVITDVGKEALASYLHSATTSGANTFRYIAIGTGATAESSSDTGLGVELARAGGASSYTSGAIYNVVATFAAGVGTGAIAEYGLFNTSTGGTLFSRDTESVINKGASDTLYVFYQVTFA